MPIDEEEIAIAKIRQRYAESPTAVRSSDAMLTLIALAQKLIDDPLYKNEQHYAVLGAVSLTAQLIATAELTPEETFIISRLFREMEIELRRKDQC